MIHRINFDANGDEYSQAKHWCHSEFGREESVDRKGEWMVLQVGWTLDLAIFCFRNEEDAMAFKLRWS